MNCVKSSRIALIFTSSFFITTTTHAGTVTFEPLSDSHVLPGGSIQFELAVSRNGGLAFNTADIFFGSSDIDIDSFVYAQSWIEAQAFPLLPPIYPDWPLPEYGYNAVFLGGYLSESLKGEVVVGTLTLSIPNDIAMGDYYIIVDGDRNGGGVIGLDDEYEPLFGSATITVIPEPATLVLMGIGGLAVLRRRMFIRDAPVRKWVFSKPQARARGDVNFE